MASISTKLSYLIGITRFRRISEKLYVGGDKVYREAGINFKASWFPVYYVLALAEDPITVMQIAQQIDFSHISVKNVLRELEQFEYVEIISNPDDGRSKTETDIPAKAHLDIAFCHPEENISDRTPGFYE